ncbi:MAG: DNA repair protein RadC [Gammaproteobacteria bacterium]|nr:DNA repair protein RadC [Gammaproteobacteria bacterium]
MTTHHISNRDLLAILIGKKKAQMFHKHSLTALFFAEEGSSSYHPKLFAARELIKRSLEEALREGDTLSTPAQAGDYLKVRLHGLEHEVFTCLFLDNRHRLIRAEEIFRGTISGASVYPREIVKRALVLNAAAVIFAHNHPSGVAEPSSADVALTSRLTQALALIDVRVLDHLVVGQGCVVSLAERGMV